MTEDANDTMTPAQREAIRKAYTMLGEHFERVLLVVDYEAREDEGCDAHEGFWKGGALPAVGMAEFAKDCIQRSFVREREPE